MLLKILGHVTEIAHEGPQALDMAASFRPEIVLLDIGMPKMSGYEVCRRMREQPGGKDVVIVAITGWGQEEDKRRSGRSAVRRPHGQAGRAAGPAPIAVRTLTAKSPPLRRPTRTSCRATPRTATATPSKWMRTRPRSNPLPAFSASGASRIDFLDRARPPRFWRFSGFGQGRNPSVGDAREMGRRAARVTAAEAVPFQEADAPSPRPSWSSWRPRRLPGARGRKLSSRPQGRHALRRLVFAVRK